MGGREANVVLLDENGIRSDGRKANETRKVTIKAGVLKNASGSAYIEFGGNKILIAPIMITANMNQFIFIKESIVFG